jgi:AraC-like DNA-binding protein
MSSAPLTVRDLSFLNARLLWCYEDNVAEENLHKSSDDPHIHAWAILRGSVTVTVGRRKWTARAGEWMLGSAQPYRQDFSSDARILSVNFKVEWPSGDSLIDEPLVVPAAKFPKLGRTARPMVSFIRRHFPGVKNDLWLCPSNLLSYFEMQRKFSHWMVAYVEAIEGSGVTPARMTGLDSRVLALLRQLDQHTWGTPYREVDAARPEEISVRHMDRLFVQQMGQTPREYLQKRRYESAVAFLSDSAAPVKRIGYDLGFSSPGHFSHWFQKITGQSPSQFRTARRREPIQLHSMK